MDWNLCPREDARSWLRVALVRGMAPSMLRALLRAFGTPASLLAVPADAIEALGGAQAARAFREGADARLVESTMRWLEAADHHLVAWGDPRYPRLLLEIANPPPLLHVAGRVELLRAPAFAIVGSRNASAQGARDAYHFAHALSGAGLAIVSGLAMGIDAAAHRGGLANGGSSIAVMGTGPDLCYPADNAALAAALARDGCLVSEFPLGTAPRAGNFPRRNRLISGMSKGVLVVEAALGSGSLTTARRALEQDRDVFAIPGSIHSPLSKGCHWLIKEGAKLAESADDILVELGWEALPPAGPAARGTTRDAVLASMAFGPVSLEQLAERTGIAIPSLAARVSALELEGRICALPGGLFQRIDRRAARAQGRASADGVIE
jgi:DNA processing protein